MGDGGRGRHGRGVSRDPYLGIPGITVTNGGSSAESGEHVGDAIGDAIHELPEGET